LALIFRNLLDESRTWQFSIVELKTQMFVTFHWFGTILAASYAALYARFASQWTYLANLYNQIKAAECRADCDQDKLAEWKAGFMEDAEELHLAGKPLFASVLHAWGMEEKIKEQFKTNAPGGAARFDVLMQRVQSVYDQTSKRRSS
jgi:hypothetical protein